jgi:hypothetical protein
LGDAAGQAGALGDPETIFAAIDENLSHTFIMSDSESVRETCPGLAGLGIVCGSRASPCVNRSPRRSPRPANRPVHVAGLESRYCLCLWGFRPTAWSESVSGAKMAAMC